MPRKKILQVRYSSRSYNVLSSLVPKFSGVVKHPVREVYVLSGLGKDGVTLSTCRSVLMSLVQRGFCKHDHNRPRRFWITGLGSKVQRCAYHREVRSLG